MVKYVECVLFENPDFHHADKRQETVPASPKLGKSCQKSDVNLGEGMRSIYIF